MGSGCLLVVVPADPLLTPPPRASGPAGDLRPASQLPRENRRKESVRGPRRFQEVGTREAPHRVWGVGEELGRT